MSDCRGLPFDRYYNNFDHDHVYTSNYKKWGKGGSYRTPDGEHGYTYEGVAFYIYKFARQGARYASLHVQIMNNRGYKSLHDDNDLYLALSCIDNCRPDDDCPPLELFGMRTRLVPTCTCVAAPHVETT